MQSPGVGFGEERGVMTDEQQLTRELLENTCEDYEYDLDIRRIDGEVRVEVTDSYDDTTINLVITDSGDLVIANGDEGFDNDDEQSMFELLLEGVYESA